ncbi:MAG TPA: multicopper oxidase domain-containing protein, partial [Nocardioides sp.]|nr:multicopper oxidase domain-containing protein [Nocardioides sp.]
RAPAAAPPAGRLTGQQAFAQTGFMLNSQLTLPRPFTRPLPPASPLPPVRSDATTDFYELVAQPGEAEIIAGLTTPIWGYDGLFPGPLFESHRGRRVSVRLTNELPVPIVRHLHGGLTPSPSDGYPLDLVLPPAGWSHPIHPGGRIHHGVQEQVYPLPQRASTLWYHDHRMDFTAPQVWKGLVGMHLHRDDEEAALGLPEGDHEIPLILTDRSFGPSGELLYPALDPTLTRRMGVLPKWGNGVLGDVALVNGMHAPYIEVRRGTYRLRILNASNARRYHLTLDPLPGAGEPFVQIGTDGGLMAAPMVIRSFLMSPAERVDVVVDFSRYAVGDEVVLTNELASEHTTRLLQFRVVADDDRPAWQPPERLSDVPSIDAGAAVRTRQFTFSRVPMHGGAMFLIAGEMFAADVVAAAPRQGDVEIWELRSDLEHPVHLHNTHFTILGDDGPAALKDVVPLTPNDTARIAVRFDSFRGRYLFHCHNLEHEDMGMMATYLIR